MDKAQPTKHLPLTYQLAGAIDVHQDRRLLLVLNLAGLLIITLVGWLLLRWAYDARPYDLYRGLQIMTVRSLRDLAVLTGGLLGLTTGHVLVHEAFHGIFFWLFTRARPRFAFHITYAYAAAPGWYLPRRHYMIITLAPLVLISLIGLLAAAYGPADWLLPALFVVTMNAGGAAGDMLVALRLLQLPPGSMSEDRGDAVFFYSDTGNR